MLRWYLSPSPNFFSDWLWPYCETLYSQKDQFEHKLSPILLFDLSCQNSMRLHFTIRYSTLLLFHLLLGKFLFPSHFKPDIVYTTSVGLENILFCGCFFAIYLETIESFFNGGTRTGVIFRLFLSMKKICKYLMSSRDWNWDKTKSDSPMLLWKM